MCVGLTDPFLVGCLSRGLNRADGRDIGWVVGWSSDGEKASKSGG